jgi:spermidine dehydrogenase
MVKTPLIYTNVLLRNWQAWKKLRLGAAYCPGAYHSFSMIDFPVSLGSYKYSSDPDEPIVIHMNRVPIYPGETPDEQYRAGHMELFTTPFESIERQTRTHLAGMLEGGGFDPARDIAGITVNRWPHGYAPYFVGADDPNNDTPNVVGRKRFGRITIANSDAGANAMLETAIDEAHRAVEELKG